jgi:hypothetical protein
MHAFFVEALSVFIESEGLDGEPPEADSDHLNHEFIKDVHVFLVWSRLY